MYTRIERPETLDPRELDRYLDRGWYRIGQTLMTCRFLLWGGVLRSAIWTRTPLEEYRYRKGLRKLMNRNSRRFRLTESVLTRAMVDRQREALYQRYLTVARGDRAADLQDFLFGESPHDLFNTREIAIWDGDRLVGFSWFDIGGDSVQSLLGVYEPDFASHSLGFYSMLLEVQHGLENGLKFHYSGYVLPGEPVMDYKLRVGHMYWLDAQRNQWRPWEEFNREAMPTQQLRRALWSARAALLRRGVPSAMRGYPMFEAGAYDPELSSCLDQPLVLECFPRRGAGTALMITWDLERSFYELVRCARAVGRFRSNDGESFDTRVELWVVMERLSNRSTAEGIAAEAARVGSPVR